jgi:hypothetical protein
VVAHIRHRARVSQTLFSSRCTTVSTENSAPLLCELFIEEYERENKDLNSPTYIGLLDGKSAIDVVVHANMIRRLFQIGFSKQSITLINNLYTNASSCIKWKNQISKSMISIEQGVRQGKP